MSRSCCRFIRNFPPPRPDHLADRKRACHKVGLNAPIKTACCYPTNPGFVEASAEMIRAGYDRALAKANGLGIDKPRILFSAHGALKAVITKRGDPYQSQIEKTSAAVVEKMAIDGLDWNVCYQSRVGPMEWIGPSTEDEIARAGREQGACCGADCLCERTFGNPGRA